MPNGLVCERTLTGFISEAKKSPKSKLIIRQLCKVVNKEALRREKAFGVRGKLG